MNKETLKKLQAPFPDEQLGVRVLQKREHQDERGTTVYLVVAPYLPTYLIHRRLDEVDPSWQMKIVSFVARDPKQSRDKGRPTTASVAVELTVAGITRCGVGDGGDGRAALSFALKSAAAQFGIGRFLRESPKYSSRFLQCSPEIAKKIAFEWTWAEVLQFLEETSSSSARTRTGGAVRRRMKLTGEAKSLFIEVKNHNLDPDMVLRRAYEEGILEEEKTNFAALTPEEIEAIREALDEWAIEITGGDDEIPF